MMLTSEFDVSTDRSRLDVALIHGFLSRSSYWALGRSRALVERSIENSLCFGAYRGDQQIGFARVITDYAVFGYVADVFVVAEFRRCGVAKLLMHAIVEHPELKQLGAMLLGTRDAHGLYAQFGFVRLGGPTTMMKRSASS